MGDLQMNSCHCSPELEITVGTQQGLPPKGSFNCPTRQYDPALMEPTTCSRATLQAFHSPIRAQVYIDVRIHINSIYSIASSA